MARDDERKSVRIRLGRVLATPGALREIHRAEIEAALGRHQSGDWGDVDKEDWATNDASIGRRHRLLSVYRSQTGVKFWIITEADRSVTTILLPDEY